MTIGQAIKAHRKAVHASASWLAERMGVHRNTVANWESGRTELTASELIGVAWHLGCPTMGDCRLAAAALNGET